MIRNYIFLTFCIFSFGSCSLKVENILIGKDQCHFCKMTIADVHYGGAVLSSKGKTYKFDDMYCTRSFIQSGYLEKNEIKAVYIQNYLGDNELLDIQSAYIIEGPKINGPMNGKWIGFKSKSAYSTLAKEIQGIFIIPSKIVE